MAEHVTTWRTVGVSLAVVAACLYLPFSWLLLIAYPWGGGYRPHWVNLWPVLPGFAFGTLPGGLIFHRHLPYETETMAAAALVLLVGLTWLGATGRRRLAVAA